MSDDDGVQRWLAEEKLSRFLPQFEASGFDMADIEFLDSEEAMMEFIEDNLRIKNTFNSRKIKKKLNILRERWEKNKKRKRSLEGLSNEENTGESDIDDEGVGEPAQKRRKTVCAPLTAFASHYVLFDPDENVENCITKGIESQRT